MNQGRHPGREATRRSVQQASSRHPALIAFIHSRILPHLRKAMLAHANRERVALMQDAEIDAILKAGAA